MPHRKSYAQAVSGKKSVRSVQKGLDEVLQSIVKNIQKLPTQYQQKKQEQKPKSIKTIQKKSVVQTAEQKPKSVKTTVQQKPKSVSKSIKTKSLK